VIYLGIDLGAVGLKAAVVGTGSDQDLLRGRELPPELWHPPLLLKTLPGGEGAVVAVCTPRRLRGRPLDTTRALLADLFEDLGGRPLDGVRLTGSGARLLASNLGLPEENEFRALSAATRLIAPGTRTLFEIGGESSKILFLELDEVSGDLGISDYQTNGDCAAGTGAFLDQQAGRLEYPIEEVGQVAAGSDRAAKIAGRCSVFAKSDMIHAQQKGYLPPEVLRGLCETVARNFRAAVAKGRTPEPPVLFVGGVAANQMVVRALQEAFELTEELVVPEHHASHAAIGCAVREACERQHHPFAVEDLQRVMPEVGELPAARPLSMEKVLCLRDRVQPFVFPAGAAPIDVALGIDIGSVSTNLVLLDRQGQIVREIYTRTQARPVEVVTHAMDELFRELGARVRVCSVGTTGSGRELIGELVGADSINDEITAHKTGASFIARTLLGRSVDTIFEIGGQDAKFIRLEDGIVVDFAMNEACAAGTGSFLEERAEELGVSIKDEFARRALSSSAPVRLGERCTVFMERDVNAYQHRGAATDDLLAGLALSVATNYINRVVRGRKIAGTIFFQGGTAYNDAVAAAFSQILDREIIVPPYNGVVGAVGAALLAWEKADTLAAGTRFRGWDLRKVDYRIREFTCQGCENRCDMQEFRVEGEKTFWGDQCGDRYRRRAKVEFHPVIDDLLRLRRDWLMEEYEPGPGRRGAVIMPRALYFYDRFPYWNAFFHELGFGVYTTAETNRAMAREGVEASVAEPCFPIQVAHGHVRQALGQTAAEIVFLPNMVNAEGTHPKVQSFYCPWGTTFPFVIKAAASFEKDAGRILHPLIRLRAGRETVAAALHQALRPHGVSRKETLRALGAAEESLERFRARIRAAGQKAQEVLEATGEPAVLLVGRPYNLFDPVVNIDVPRKMRDLYGVNLLPLEFLAAPEDDLEAINANMFWNYGRKILAACQAAGRSENLRLVYVTNFKCGPDSYIKHFVRDAYGRAFLTLQFDGHANDAGMLTRVEAFLDSQGILRRWAGRPPAPPDLPVAEPADGIPVYASACEACPNKQACG
jgi:predicted CoA-substrate-specific enzyme activase